MSAFSTPGRFFKGNMHTRSNRSDGARDAESVCAVYRDAGYDFLALTDHFWPDTNFPSSIRVAIGQDRSQPFSAPRYTRRRPALAHSVDRPYA
jgi:hypothetical protein